MGPGGVRSFRQLAGLAGIQPTTLTQWWTKGLTPDMATLKAVADALDVPLAELSDAYQGRPPSAPSPDDLEALLRRVIREELAAAFNRLDLEGLALGAVRLAAEESGVAPAPAQSPDAEPVVSPVRPRVRSRPGSPRG